MSSAILDFANKLADEVGKPNILGLRNIQVHPEPIVNDLRLMLCAGLGKLHECGL